MLVYRNVPHSWVKVVSDVQVIHLSHKILAKKKSAPSDPSVDPSFLALHGAPHVFWGKMCNEFPKFEFAVCYAGKKTRRRSNDALQDRKLQETI